MICSTMLNLTSMCSLKTAKLRDASHTHFAVDLKESQNLMYILFQTPTRHFDQFAPNFAWSICGPSWQKVYEKIVKKTTQNIKQ